MIALTRILKGGALGLSLLAGLAGGAALAAESKITFVLTSDIYKVEASKVRGGFSRLAAVARAEKARDPNAIYVHAGDTISPSLMSGFDKGAHIVEILNIFPPDIFVPGNHEYDFGAEIFKKRMADLKTPLKLAANLRDGAGNPVPGFADQKIMEVNGVKLGIVGLTADDSAAKSSPGPDLKFGDTVKTAIASARALRQEGADLVVAIIHAGRAEDMALYNSGAVDLILSGDDHDLAIQYNGKSAFAETYEEGSYVLGIDLTVDINVKDGKRTTTWWPNFRVIDTAAVTPDPETEVKSEVYRKELSRELDIEIGKVAGTLDSRSATVRSGEAAIGNLIADAIRWSTKADIAITNGGGIRGNKQYVDGAPFSRRDALVELPFGNRTMLIEVTGAQVLAALENGVSQVENNAGRFPQVSGLTFEYERAKPAGQRVNWVKVGGEPLDPKKTYKLATNDFMLNGGDGYRSFVGAKALLGERDGKLLANDFMAYVASTGKAAGAVEGRITAK